MPTQIVVAIDDPTNIDAWGLHPIDGGVWVPGNYAKGTVCAYSSKIWFAAVQTSATPGANSDWTPLLDLSAAFATWVASLPTSPPATPGQPWNDGQTIAIS